MENNSPRSDAFDLLHELGHHEIDVIYEELRKLAVAKLSHEKPAHTLQATALVHEAYLRPLGGENQTQWNSRGHFFAAAAEAMRRNPPGMAAVTPGRTSCRHRCTRTGNRLERLLPTLQAVISLRVLSIRGEQLRIL